MNRSLKALLVALALVVTGALLAGCSLFAMEGRVQLLTGMYQPITTTDYIEEDFSKLELDLTTLDVTLHLATDGTCRYEAKTYNNMFCNSKVENGTLIIGQDDSRAWYQHIGIFWGKTSLDIYLPEASYERLTVSTDTGNVTVSDVFSFETVRITTDTGNVNLSAAVTQLVDIELTTGNVSILNSSPNALTVKSTTGNCFVRGANIPERIGVSTTTGNIAMIDVTCGTLQLQTTTGEGDLTNVVAAGDAALRSSTGDWELEGFDAVNITISTATGDVDGTLLSDKIFLVDTTTGEVEVPRTSTGGKCEITTNTGDIEIDIAP